MDSKVRKAARALLEAVAAMRVPQTLADAALQVATFSPLVSSLRAALALPADAPAQPAPEGAGEACGGVDYDQLDMCDEYTLLACADVNVRVPTDNGCISPTLGAVARTALYYLKRAAATPRAEAASAEAVREACHAAALRVADGHLDALRWIAAQSCRGDACCASLGACVTERCETCYARAALGLPEKAAEPASPASAVPTWSDSFPPTHYCRECKALWRRWPDGSWSLVTAACGKCCDNVPMGEQIAPLASEYPTLRVERPTALATPGEVAPGAPNQAGVTAGETAPPPTHTPASAEAVREACAAQIDRLAANAERLAERPPEDGYEDQREEWADKARLLRGVAGQMRSLPLPAAPASAEAVAREALQHFVSPYLLTDAARAVAHALRGGGA